MRTWYGTGKSLQVAITACCLTAFVLFGYDQGVFGGILQNEDWLNQFDHPSDSLTGIIVSCYNLGCLGGCILNFFLGEKLGRRRAIWMAMGFVVIGAALQASAFTVPHLVIGRLVTGLGTGIKTSTVPMYQSELCDKEVRGRLVAAEVLFVGVGIQIAYWFDFGLTFVGGPLAWRLPLAFQILFALFVIVLVFGLPESPRWLCHHGKREEAMEVMSAVFGMSPHDPHVLAEMDAIDRALEVEGGGASLKSMFKIFKQDGVRTPYRVFLAWLAQFMNQAGGINLVVYYAPSVLHLNVGMSPQMAQILGGCINLMFTLGSIMPSFTLDKFGRRKTMMWGCAGLGISMLMISALLSQGNREGVGHAYASASIAFFFLYMLIFGMSVNCVPWVWVPELLPTHARAEGTAVGISSNWLWNFVIVMITPVLINRLQWKAYLIFMATNLAFVPLVYFLYPETSGLRLEDIDMLFSDGANPVKLARKLQKESYLGETLSSEGGVHHNEKEVEAINTEEFHKEGRGH